MTHTPRTRPDMAEILENLNAPQIRKDRAAARYVLAALCFALGMALAALAFSNAYARGIDAVNNPHMEGF